MTVAIIPAKGHSRRLADKNMRQFCDFPLVAWSIFQARYSKLIDKVYVTTDDAL